MNLITKVKFRRFKGFKYAAVKAGDIKIYSGFDKQGQAILWALSYKEFKEKVMIYLKKNKYL